MPTPTYNDYPGDGSNTFFAINFEYLEDEHVTVELDGVATSDFVINTDQPTKRVEMTTAPEIGVNVRVRRKSQRDTDLVDFENGSVLTESELDRAYRHNRYLHQEIGELNDSSLQKAAGTTNWDAGNNKIVNVATPTDTSDASTKDYVDSKVSQISTGASSPPNKYVFTGTAGTNTTYSVTGAEVNGDTAYDVSIDGAVQEPTTDFTVDPDTDTLTIIPTLSGGEDIVVIERGFGVALTTGNIDSGNIANNAIVESKIADDSISLAKMKANSVDSDQYVDGSIDRVHLADGAVTSDKISTTDSNFNVQSDGKVGIGTTSPSTELEVSGAIASTTLTTSGSISASSGINTVGRNIINRQDVSGAWDRQSSLYLRLTPGTQSPPTKDYGVIFSNYDGIAIHADVTDVASNTYTPHLVVYSPGTTGGPGRVGINTHAPSAPLEVTSTIGGVIIPRMNTSQRTAVSASDGEMVYDTDLHKFYGYANGAWVALH
jgi:hypothetical protein